MYILELNSGGFVIGAFAYERDFRRRRDPKILVGASLTEGRTTISSPNRGTLVVFTTKSTFEKYRDAIIRSEGKLEYFEKCLKSKFRLKK